jgi:hypothetical protein
MAGLILLLVCLVSSCSTVETRKVEVDPYTLTETPVEKKFPVSAALVLDNELKSYAIKHELVSIIPGVSTTAAYLVGPHLESCAKEAITDLFHDVRVFDSVTEAADKCDVVVVPKAVRSSTNITAPVQVMLVIEWQVMERNGQTLIWLTSVESQSSVKPTAFGHGKAEREAYTLVLSDLCSKTKEAFLKSPEVRRIARQQR